MTNWPKQGINFQRINIMKVLIDYKDWLELKAAIDYLANQIEQSNIPIGLKRTAAAQVKAVVFRIEDKKEN